MANALNGTLPVRYPYRVCEMFWLLLHTVQYTRHGALMAVRVFEPKLLKLSAAECIDRPRCGAIGAVLRLAVALQSVSRRRSSSRCNSDG